MCGIGGYKSFGKYKPELHEVSSILTALMVRGRDATGVCGIDAKGNLSVIKAPIKADDFVKTKAYLGLKGKMPPTMIVHTRAKTTGSEKNPLNNHPIYLADKGIALVHNGMIHNHDEVFKEQGYSRQAEVDSEAIIRAVESKMPDVVAGLAEVAKVCRGSAAFALVSKDFPDKLVLARNNNPLEILIDKDRDIIFFASIESALRESVIGDKKDLSYRGFKFEVKNPLEMTMPRETYIVLGKNAVEATGDFKMDTTWVVRKSSYEDYDWGNYRRSQGTDKYEADNNYYSVEANKKWLGLTSGIKQGHCDVCRSKDTIKFYNRAGEWICECCFKSLWDAGYWGNDTSDERETKVEKEAKKAVTDGAKEDDSKLFEVALANYRAQEGRFAQQCHVCKDHFFSSVQIHPDPNASEDNQWICNSCSKEKFAERCVECGELVIGNFNIMRVSSVGTFHLKCWDGKKEREKKRKETEAPIDRRHMAVTEREKALIADNKLCLYCLEYLYTNDDKVKLHLPGVKGSIHRECLAYYMSKGGNV